jgi:hypothetical protein
VQYSCAPEEDAVDAVDAVDEIIFTFFVIAEVLTFLYALGFLKRCVLALGIN